jgi:hypothetical protein
VVKSSQKKRKGMPKNKDLKSRMSNRSVKDSRSGQSCHKKIEIIDNLKIPSKLHSCVSRIMPKRCNYRAKNMPFSKNALAATKENGYIFTRVQLPLRNSWRKCVRQSLRPLQMQMT